MQDLRAQHRREIVPEREPRHFSDVERESMAQYESLETYEPETTLFRDYLETRSHEPRWFMWVLVLAIGMLCGALTVLLVSSLHVLNSLRYELLGFGLRGFTFHDSHRYPCPVEENRSDCPSTRTGLDVRAMFTGESVGLYGVRSTHPGYGFLMFATFSVGCACVVSLVSFLIPDCAGSGLPEVKAYMNGVLVSSLSDLRTLAARTVTILFSVGSGVCTGYYGPAVLSGAMLASQTLRRRKWVRCYNIHFIDCFRNPRDRRVLMVIGAAAGMASALCAPISGLLLVLELLSSVFPTHFALYTFVACLVATLGMQVYFSYLVYFDVRERSSAVFAAGELLPQMGLLFRTQVGIGKHVKMNLLFFLPAVGVGLLCGWLSAWYVRLNWLSLVLRRKLEVSLGIKTTRYVLPIVFTGLYATVQFWTAVVGFPDDDGSAAVQRTNAGCTAVPWPICHTRNVTSIAFYGLNGFLCAMPANATLCYSDAAGVQASTGSHQSMIVVHGYASLSWAYADSAVQTLLSIRTPTLLSPLALAVFGVTYFFFSGLYSGVALCVDTIAPSLVIGGTLGRLCGLAVYHLATGWRADAADWADPGVFALLGAGCFVSGTSGLTFSVGAMLMESTGDFHHFLPLMIGIAIARRTVSLYTHDLHTTYLEVHCVPLLNMEARIHKYSMVDAQHVMRAPVSTIVTVPTLERILHVLQSTRHNAFPIVSVHDGTYKGMLGRSQLTLALWHVFYTGRTTHPSYEVLMQRLPDRLFHEGLLEQLPRFDAAHLSTRVDLSAYVDPSGFAVLRTTALPRAYEEFMTLGLRHLVVVDEVNRVVGIITRKDLMSDRISDCVRRADDQRRRLLCQQDRNQHRWEPHSTDLRSHQRVLAARGHLDGILGFSDTDDGSNSGQQTASVLPWAALHPLPVEVATAMHARRQMAGAAAMSSVR